jgi:P27 family predicted phage terminase small subunit
MGGRGFPPAPTVLKLLRGNPSKEKINRDEPQPRGNDGVPSPPDFLIGYARDEWERIAPELHYMKILTRVDMRPLAAYCQAYSVWRTCVEAFNSTAEIYPDMQRVIATSDNGNHTQSPILGAMRNAALEMVKHAAEFGFTPAARSRISVKPQGESKSKFEGLLSG